MSKILVTGGAGYIGSHTVLSLLQENHQVTVFDNLECSDETVLGTIKKLTKKPLEFIKGDIRKVTDLEDALVGKGFDAVVHFAAYKNVKESMEKPDTFYENNVVGTLNLLQTMRKAGIKNIVFSSSCSVHGQPKTLPVKEDDELAPLSPYARTKLAVEYMLSDFALLGINSVRLRYFNAAGAHPSGEMGENPKILLNLIPRIVGTALGKYNLKIFGQGFKTKDGYQERDYIHVMDLADAHVKAIKYLESKKGSFVFGLSTGVGTSVMQIVKEVEKVMGKKINYEIVPPIAGDPIQVFGDYTNAEKELGWKPKYQIEEIIEHAWKWYQNNLEKF